MNQPEARRILRDELARFRGRTFVELRSQLGSPEMREIVGASGTVYQLEIEALWDDRPDGNQRVVASIDDGGLRALAPVCDDFIVTSSGSFVDE